jgi:hypothetical protein
MRSDLDGFLDEGPPRRQAAEGIRGLTFGAKLVLAAALLLFFSLFLTWQNLEIDYGGTGTDTQMLDGWDVFGVVTGLLTLGLLAFVVVVRLYDPDLAEEISTERVSIVLATAILGLVVVKNLTDRDSAWASYLAVALAAAVFLGACLDLASARIGRRAVPGRKRRRIRRVA